MNTAHCHRGEPGDAAISFLRGTLTYSFLSFRRDSRNPEPILCFNPYLVIPNRVPFPNPCRRITSILHPWTTEDSCSLPLKIIVIPGGDPGSRIYFSSHCHHFPLPAVIPVREPGSISTIFSGYARKAIDVWLFYYRCIHFPCLHPRRRS